MYKGLILNYCRAKKQFSSGIIDYWDKNVNRGSVITDMLLETKKTGVKTREKTNETTGVKTREKNKEKTGVKTREKNKEKTGVKTREKNKEKTGEKIRHFISLYPQITIKELAYKTGLSIKGVEWQIQKLKKAGYLKRIGPAKGGYWKIKQTYSK